MVRSQVDRLNDALEAAMRGLAHHRCEKQRECQCMEKALGATIEAVKILAVWGNGIDRRPVVIPTKWDCCGAKRPGPHKDNECGVYPGPQH